MNAICPICLNSFMKLEGHHVHPKEYGGNPNGDLLWLCSSCHHNIHYTANAKFSNSTKTYLTEAQLQRAKPYVDLIVRARNIWETSSRSKNNFKRLIISLEESDLIKLHKLKSDRGFTNIETFVRSLLLKELKTL